MGSLTLGESMEGIVIVLDDEVTPADCGADEIMCHSFQLILCLDIGYFKHNLSKES